MTTHRTATNARPEEAEVFGRARRPAHEASGGAPSESTPAVIVAPGGLVEMVEAAAAALRAAGSPLYDRGGMLVRPVRIESADRAGGITRPEGALVLRPVTPAWLAHELQRVATWQKFDERARNWRAVDPPERVATTIVDAPDLGSWPQLYAVLRAPVVLPDGRVLSEPGYDPGSALLADWNESWPITEEPALDDAADALHRLQQLLRNYPFETPADRAVAISLILTAIERPALSAAPLHAVSSPEPGAGKSMLVDAGASAATGTPAAVMDWGRDNTEAAKRIDAVMLAGDSIIALDNVERPLEGAALCQLLTQGARRLRPLGASVAVTVPCSAMVAATGCNLTLRGDVVRRAVLCRIDPGMERPELRQIEQDLIGEVHARRTEIVADAVTIILAYARAGFPDLGLPPLGGYADWSRMVRTPLVWAGAEDPCSTMDRLRADDPQRAAQRTVYHTWAEMVGNEAVTCAELLRRSEDRPRLREALALVAERKGRLTAASLGYWCRMNRDRRLDGLRLTAEGQTRDGAQQWSIKE